MVEIDASASHTFRVFVSSTFSDLKAERDALQERVFPKLSDLAVAHSCRFQAIDLRWGVSEEAALDQQTMKICLDEIVRCQDISPRPNFIILLGDRYGWRPLPYEIDADEFETINVQLSPEGRKLSGEWYRRDENAVPPAFLLRPRTGENLSQEVWEPIERRLHALLEDAAIKCHLDDAALVKYRASATEQEILEGALKVGDADQHVFAYFRELKGTPRGEIAKSYLDYDSGCRDEKAAGQLKALKKAVSRKLGKHCHTFPARWQADGPTQEHLDKLCTRVEQDLSRIMLEQLKLLERDDPVAAEHSAHRHFATEKSRYFTGRTDSLDAILQYLRFPQDHIFAVTGEPGIGKSALISRALELAGAEKDHQDQVRIYRSIGATPTSFFEHDFLRNLYQQICREVNLERLIAEAVETKWTEEIGYVDERAAWEARPVSFLERSAWVATATKNRDEYEASLAPMLSPPPDYDSLVGAFKSLLNWVLPQRKICLILDGMEQLEASQTQLGRWAWLPRSLDGNLWLVVSFTPDKDLAAFIEAFPQTHVYEVPGFTVEEGREFLRGLLRNQKRCLQPGQEQVILTHLSRNGLPLFVELAVQIASRWHAYDPPIEIPETVPGLIESWLTDLARPNQHGEVFVRSSLAYLATSRRGLSEEELLGILEKDKALMADFSGRSHWSSGSRLPIVVWLRLFNDLKGYLSDRFEDGARVMAFTHPQIKSAILQSYLPISELADRSQLVAEYFCEQPLYFQGEDTSYPNRRKLSEQVYQLAQAGKASLLAKTLLDFEFLYARMNEHGVSSVRRDFARAITSELFSAPEQAAVLQIAQILDQANDILQQAPEQLPSQLLARLEDPGKVQSTCAQAKAFRRHAWLMPRTASLRREKGGASLTLPGNLDRIRTVAFSADQKLACAGSEGGLLRVWDLERGQEICTVGLGYGLETMISIPGTDMLLLLSKKGRLAIWSITAQQEQDHLELGDHSWLLGRLVLDGKTCLAAVNGEVCWIDLSSERMEILRRKACSHPVVNVDAGLVIYQKSGHRYGWRYREDQVEELGAGLQEETFDLFTSSSDGGYLARAVYGAISLLDGSTGQLIRELPVYEELGYLRGKTAVKSLCFSSSGLLIAGCGDHTIKVFDALSGLHWQTLSGHTAAVSALSVSGDGKLLSGSEDGKVSIWDTNLSPDFDPSFPGIGPLTALAWKSDGTMLVCASQDGHLAWLDVSSKKVMRIIATTCLDPHTLILTPNGKEVILAGSGQSASRWVLDDGTLAREYVGHSRKINCLALNSERALLISGGEDKTCRVWDLETGEERLCYTQHESGITALTIEGAVVLSVEKDGYIQSWNPDNGDLYEEVEAPQSLQKLAVKAGSSYVGIARDLLSFYSKGQKKAEAQIFHVPTTDYILDTERNRAFTAGKDQRILELDLSRAEKFNHAPTFALVRALIGHNGVVSALAISPDGQRLASASLDGSILLWDIAARSEEKGHTDRINAFAFSRDKKIVASSSDDLTIKTWLVSSGHVLQTYPGFRDKFSGSGSIDISSDGRYLAASIKKSAMSPDANLIRIWQLESGKEVDAIRGKVGSFDGLQFLDSPNELACTDQTQTAVWDMNTRQITRGVGSLNHLLDLTPDGHYALTADWSNHSKNYEIRFSDLFTRQCRNMALHTRKVTRAFFIDAPHQLVSAGEDGKVIFWDQRKGNVRTLLEIQTAVQDMLRLPDGNLLAIMEDGDLWSIPLAKQEPVKLIRVPGKNQNLVILERGETAAVAGSGHTIWVVDVRKRRIETAFDLEATVTSIAAVDDTTLLLGDSLGGVHFLEHISGE